MKQKESDIIAIELLNLEETFQTTGLDRAMVIANAATKCVRNLRKSFPTIDSSMNEIEILRQQNN